MLLLPLSLPSLKRRMVETRSFSQLSKRKANWMGAHGSITTSTTISITIIRTMLPCMAISGFSLELLLGEFLRRLSLQNSRARVHVALPRWVSPW